MPGHIKVPHRDDLIGLEAAYKSSVVALLINKRLIDEGKLIDVYIFESINNQMVIAVPDWLWSYQIEVSEIINRDTCIETLLMQLFVLKRKKKLK